MLTENRGPSELSIQDQWASLCRIIRRHTTLAGLTLLASMFLGGLYYIYAPRWYESSAELLISSKEIGGFRGGPENQYPVDEKTIETHIELIRSPLIVGMVLERTKELPKFLAESENPVQLLRDCLTVTLKNENSMVLLVQLRLPDPRQSQELLNGLVQVYQDYMGESAAELGHEVFSLIARAKDDLAQQIRETQRLRNEFRATAPLLWENGQPVNIHHERQKEIEAQRKKMVVERSTLRAKIASLEALLQQGGVSQESLYYEALRELHLKEEDPELKALRIAEQEHFTEREALRQSASLLTAEYVRLKVEQSELLDEFDAGHPKAQDVGKRMEEVRNMLIALMENRMPIEGLLNDGVLPKKSEKDYVRIYMQMLRDHLAVLDRQIEQLDAQFQEEQEAANLIVKYQHQDQEYSSDLAYATQLFEQVIARLREIDLLKSYGGDTMTPIALPRLGERVAPRLLPVALASLMMGLLASIVVCWLVDAAEKTFHSTAEVRQGLGIPVVGQIPIIIPAEVSDATSLSSVDPMVCTVHQESSVLAEAFRSVRTKLYFSGGAQKRVIQITSPSPADGKSTVAVNLAVAIAKSGKRVLLVDADFRRPVLDKLLGVSAGSSLGLAGVIAGKVSWQEAVCDSAVENLTFLPATECPKNPSEILSTERFEEVLAELRQHFDFVIMDTPPLLPVTDPCAVAARVDGTLLVMRIRPGVQLTGRQAVEMLQGVQAKIVGVILNGVSPHWGHEEMKSRYGYGYGYGRDAERGVRHGDHESNGNGKPRLAAMPLATPPTTAVYPPADKNTDRNNQEHFLVKE